MSMPGVRPSRVSPRHLRALRCPPTARAALALVAVLVLPSAALAGSGGPDGGGYAWTDTADGCGVVTDSFTLSNSEAFFDGATIQNNIGPIDLGFTFPFYDTVTTQVWVNRSGLVFFEPPADSFFGTPTPIPDGAVPPGFLAAYWTLMNVGTGSVSWQDFPAAGYFKLSFEAAITGSGPVRFEVYLHRDGNIRVEYLDIPTTTPTNGLTIGMESPDETTGLEVFHDGTASGGFNLTQPRPFAICYERPPTLDCAPASPISCGSNAGQSPASVTRNAERYGCGTGVWSGLESVHELTITELSDVTITLAEGTMNGGAVFLLNECNEYVCLDGGGATASAQSLTPGTYLVVVDTPAARDGGTYTLEIDCQPLSQPIACEETLADTTAGGPSRLNTYSCVAGDFSGPESYFVLDFAPPGNINVSLTGGAGMAVFIFDANDELIPGNCLRGGLGGTVLYDPPPGSYVIVVDGPAGAGSDFTLQVSCAPEISCAATTPLGCTESLDMSTVGRTNRVDFYRCSGVQYSGPEIVYELTVTATQVYSFLLDDSADPRLDLLLLDDCNEGACIEIGDSAIDVELAPGTYYLVVDGQGGAEAPFSLQTLCGVGIEPATISVTGAAGECFEERKTVWMTPDITKADVLFAIDLTGSMGGERAQLQANMQGIIDNLQTFIPDVNFGLVSYKDYPTAVDMTTPCVETSTYGGATDYPYRLEQTMTGDRTAIGDAVDALPGATGGSDGPESYSRVFFEAYSDPGIGWRPGSRRILVNFGDERPHDCNILSCLGGAGQVHGIDLGRDGVAETADDLALADVIQGLSDNEIVLLHLESSGGNSEGGFTYEEIWDCWAQQTGGRAVALNADGTVPGGLDLSELIGGLIAEQGAFCSTLLLRASPGFEDWLVSSVPTYTDVSLPAVVEFDIQICVPAGTPVGVYEFEVQAICSGGFVTAQQVTVEVTEDCSASVVMPPSDQVVCEGGSATLDASGLSLVNCDGAVDYTWRDEGGAVVATSPTTTVTPADTTTYEVTVSCPTDATCTIVETATVEVHLLPILDVATALDPADCNLGIEVTWPAATFRDPSGTGVYNVYRSETSCADAVTRAPLVSGLTDTRWIDTTTRDGRSYFYVVEAEDARMPSACTPQGPNNGGSVARTCAAEVIERAAETLPEGVFATLFASHVGQEVTFTWETARPLIGAEHFHLLKARDSAEASFFHVNGEGDTSRSYTETDTSSPLQFFDLRVANGCEELSQDEFPPGYDN